MGYRSNRFKGYTLADCSCELCLHDPGEEEPCVLEVCCCEEVKFEAARRAASKPHLPPLRHKQNPIPPKVVCHFRPECAGCNYPAHGFLCQFKDGSCLRCSTPYKSEVVNNEAAM